MDPVLTREQDRAYFLGTSKMVLQALVDATDFGLYSRTELHAGTRAPRAGSHFLTGVRIVTPRVAHTPFFRVIEGSMNPVDMLVIKTPRIDAHYLAGYLNSSLVRFWLRHAGYYGAGTYRPTAACLRTIPLVTAPAELARMVAVITRICDAWERVEAGGARQAGERSVPRSLQFARLRDALIFARVMPSVFHGVDLVAHVVSVGLLDLEAASGQQLLTESIGLGDAIFHAKHPIAGVTVDLAEDAVVQVVESERYADQVPAPFFRPRVVMLLVQRHVNAPLAKRRDHGASRLTHGPTHEKEAT